MPGPFDVFGVNAAAPFTLRALRGEGMVLLAMNWRAAQPPDNFVGFGIEYQEPNSAVWHPVHNRLSFTAADGDKSTLQSPIQKFRWVHFPQNAGLAGAFTYRVTPLFMGTDGALTDGETQTASIELGGETYPDQLNVAFTRGFVSSQAFVDRYQKDGDVSTLVAGDAKTGLSFEPTHSDAAEALPWMGFEARQVILDVLDLALAPGSDAEVRVVAYDLNLPEIVKDRLVKLGARLRIIIDDSGTHGDADSAETQAAALFAASAGADHVKRQHMASLQHNKTVIVSGTGVNKVVCGSTNFSWRGFYIQNNNAVVLTGTTPVKVFGDAFETYWQPGTPTGMEASDSAKSWSDLGVADIYAKVTFSPHGPDSVRLAGLADDIGSAATSVFYSLAFLYQTTGPVRDAIKKVTEDPAIFVYGISDKKVGGIDLQTPDGNVQPVSPAALNNEAPAPFKPEPSGGSGVHLHHKFVVLDFDQPDARVYLGSYNFSKPADIQNGENLLLLRDQRVAVSYMIEAVRIFDHYEYRVLEAAATSKQAPLLLHKPPAAGQAPWWKEDYVAGPKQRDRLLFAGKPPA